MLEITIALQALIAFLIGTLLFDLVHFSMHQFLTSKYQWLRAIGRLHSAHHRFFSATLKIQTEWTQSNLLQHVLFENIINMLGIAVCFLFFKPMAVYIALVINLVMLIAAFYWRGIDPHHQPYDKLPSYRGGLWVSADYHALHHVYPNSFFSGYLKLLDYILGTGQQLKGKRIAMTGANGALGSHMKVLLEKEGAIVTAFKYGSDYTYEDYSQLSAPLSQTDILFLCHGSKYDYAQQANCDSFVSIIELFKSVAKPKLLPIEIWAVGSEIECHPCFGIKKIQVYARSKRNYAKVAKHYYHDRNIQYRHIVHSAFTSPMGPGLMSAKFAARWTIFMLKRGFKYVPVSYAGFAYLNFFRYAFNFQFTRRVPFH